MAGSADALKVFAAVWIPCPQSPDKPCWHDVIHMPPRSSLPKIHAAQLDFAYSAESLDTVTPSAVPARGCTRPLTVNTFPTYRFLLRPETRLAKLAATVTIGLATTKQGFEDFRLAIPAVRTTHGCELPFSRIDYVKNDTLRRKPVESTRDSISIAKLRNDQELGYSS